MASVTEANRLTPLKVNVVLLAGANDDEVLDFAGFARETGRIVRFVEFMPLDADGTWRRDRVVPTEWVLNEIHSEWPLEAVKSLGDPAPAARVHAVTESA